MATAVNASGSQACTVGTEHTLATVTAAANYQAQFDIPPRRWRATSSS